MVDERTVRIITFVLDIAATHAGHLEMKGVGSGLAYQVDKIHLWTCARTVAIELAKEQEILGIVRTAQKGGPASVILEVPGILTRYDDLAGQGVRIVERPGSREAPVW